MTRGGKIRFAKGGLVIVAFALSLSGCVRDACNNECADGLVCDELRLACVPEGSNPGGGGGVVSCEGDAECPTAHPRCEPDSGRCVKCVSNADCPDGRCDPFTFTCQPRGCASSADCGADLPFCAADGECVECRANLDCRASGGVRRTCDQGTRRCVANPCRESGDCVVDPDGRVCDEDAGRCVECTRDEHCPTGRCRVALNRCVECLNDLDCDVTLGETCRVETSTCVVTGCANDAHCEGPQRCDLAARTCFDCLGDADCAFGGECSEARTCVDPTVCVGDSDCLFPGVCDNARCVACREDADCAGGLLCEAGDCKEPSTCASSDDCGRGRRCDDGACVDAECANDPFEPNDSSGDATPLSPGVIEAVLCHNDVDHYALQAQEGAGVGAVVTWMPDGGDAPMLELVAGLGGPVIVTPAAETSPGRLVATLESAGQGTTAVLVRVSRRGGEPVPYRLETTVSALGLCADDEREPDNTRDRATRVSPGVFEGVLCPTSPGEPEVDWFAVDVPAEHRVGALLSIDQTSTDAATVEIYAVSDGNVVREAEGFVSAVSTSVSPADGTRYWVAVRNLTERKLTYSLSIDVRPRPPANDACLSDLSMLPVLSPGSVTGHTLGASDDGESSCGGTGGDVFWRLSIPEPSKVRLTRSAAFPTTLSLASDCSALTELACTNTLEGDIAFDGLPAGDYVVRLSTLGEEQGRYIITTEIERATAPPVGDACDIASPLPLTNDVALVEGNLALATNALDSACGEDGKDAFWGVSLAEPRRVVVTLEGAPGLSVALVSKAGCGVDAPVRCEAIAESGARAKLDLLAVPAGDWVLVVDGGTLRSGAFTLRVELGEALYPPPNDACESVVTLLEGETTGDTRGARDDFAPVCGAAVHAAGDAVWRLTVTEPEEDIELALSAEYDAALVVTDGPCGTGQALACKDGPSANVRFPALAAGDYYVWVDGYAAEEGRFTLTMTRRPVEPVPVNDLCEEAQTLDLASGIVEVSGSTARATDAMHPLACAPLMGSPLLLDGPDVSYRVEIPAGRTLRATLQTDGWDGALYALDLCEANTCRDASDSFVPGAEERVTVHNPGPSPLETLIVVDSYNAEARGAFTLRVELEQP